MAVKSGPWRSALTARGLLARVSSRAWLPVKVWDMRADLVSNEFTGHAGVVFSVAWHPDGQRIASSGRFPDGKGFVVKVWDAHTGREAFKRVPGGETFAVAFSPDGRHLVTGGASQTVQVWDVQIGGPVSTLGAHDRVIRGLVFSRDGQHLASVSADGAVKLWDATRLGEQQLARLTLRAGAAGGLQHGVQSGRTAPGRGG